MKRLESRDFIGFVAIAPVVLALAGCGPTQVVAPLPPPPPLPPPVVIPPQPRPPLGAPGNIAVPAVDATGTRRMINYAITPAQTVWNMRSAYNVAALNCMRPEDAPILEGYRAFLKTNAKRLTAINKLVDKEFAARAGKGGVRAREAYMTQVYNFYALPPTLPAFCDAVLALTTAATGLASKDLDSFAVANLPRIDLIFLQFYDSYDQYRADLAAWQARYAPTSAPADGAPSGGLPMPAAGMVLTIPPASSGVGPTDVPGRN